MVEECTVGERIDMIERGLREIAADFCIRDFAVTQWTLQGRAAHITAHVQMENGKLNFPLMFPDAKCDESSHFHNKWTAERQGARIIYIEPKGY